MTSQPPERRRFPRHQPHAHVEMRGGGEVAVLPIVDISAGGAFLHMTAQDLPGLTLGEQVAVFLDATCDQDPLHVAVPARVVRIERGHPRSGLALQWTEHSPETAGKLAQAVARFGR